MHNITIINLSPRQKGTSDVIANLCREFLIGKNHKAEYFNLYSCLNKLDQIYESIGRADTIILSGPSYINCYPADTIALLQGILSQKHLLHEQKLYGIIQGGMPYAHTHYPGIKTLELFCKEAGIQFGGGFVLGLGAYLNGRPLDKHPFAKRIREQFNLFLNHIERGEVSPKEVFEKAEPKIPVFLAAILVKGMNRKIEREAVSKGIRDKQYSPYLFM